MKKKLFTFRNGLLLSILALGLSTVVLLVLYVNAIVSIVKEPTPQSSIIVNKDVTLTVPNKIVAGQTFNYNIVGEKLLDIGGTVRMQLNCTVNGSESIITMSTYYSKVPVGKFNVTRNTIIPVDQRYRDSNDCHIELIASYIFYQTDNEKVLRPIQVDFITTSNHFSLTTTADN